MLNQVEAYVIVGLVSDKDSFFKSNVMCSPQNKKGIERRYTRGVKLSFCRWKISISKTVTLVPHDNFTWCIMKAFGFFS